MPHKFNPKQLEKLDNPERRKRFDPEAIIRLLPVKGGDTVVDIGCGSGYFTIPLGRLVGDSGLVYALDISGEMLSHLKDRQGNAKNIRLVNSGQRDFKLKSGIADVIFSAFVLHEAVDKKAFLTEAKRLLRPGGAIVVVDWAKKEMDMGPPVNDRVDVSEAARIIRSVGFDRVSDIKINDMAYCLKGETA